MTAPAANKRRRIAVVTSGGDVVSENLFARYALKSDEKSRAMPVDRFKSAYGQSGLVEPHYNPETLAQILELNTWHARCVHTKAGDVAGLGYGLTPAAGSQDSANDTERQTFAGVLSAPNLGHTPDELLTELWIDYEATGNAYMEVVRENYEPDAPPKLLKRLAAHTVRVHNSGDLFCQVRGTKKIWFKRFGLDRDVDYKTGHPHAPGSLAPSERASEVIQVKAYAARSDYYGLPEWFPSIGAIEAIRAARDYNISFFDNHGVPAYAVYITGDYDLGEPDDNGEYEVVKNMKQHLKNIASNPGTPLVMAIPSDSPTGTVKVEIEKLAVETKDSHFRMYRKDSRDEILCAHGVPPYRIGIAETGSLGGNTAEASDKIYNESVLAPRKRKLEAVFNLLLLPALDVTSWKFYLEDLDYQDDEHDMKVAGFLFDKGGITPNQLIKYFGDRFGIEPDDSEPALDWHYVDGKPVEAEAQAQENAQSQAEGIVKGLHDRLVNIAIKSEIKEEERQGA